MLKWFKKKIVVILSAALILPGAGQLGNRWYSGQSVCAAETASRTDEETNTLHLESNKTNQNYSIWGSCVKSYLSIDNGMYCEIQGLSNGNVSIVYYDSSHCFLSRNIIDAELPIFGGFYEGQDNYYIVWGQENKNESDSVEVMRVVKYDKYWNRILSSSVYGANTYIPFEAGSLRMTEYNGYLYIHTCHQMYKSEDGLRHQANMTYEIRESDMDVVDPHYMVENEYGYVSHSFNQFLIIDDDANIVTLDHGDAYPRAAVLNKYCCKAGNEGFTNIYNEDKYTYPDIPEFILSKYPFDTFNVLSDGDNIFNKYNHESVNVFTYLGNIGDNNTESSIGGLEYSTQNYLTTGNSAVQGKTVSSVRNVYITVTKRQPSVINSMTGSRQSSTGTIAYMLTYASPVNNYDTNLKWITNYTEGADVSSSTPQLVKINDNSFLLLWEQMKVKSSESLNKISYVFLDDNGNTTSSVYTEDGNLSDCKPVVSGNEVVWYVADDGKCTFYAIDLNGKLTSNQAVFPSSITIYPKPITDCRIIFTKIGPIPDEEYTTDCLAVIDEGKVLVEHKDYQYRGNGSSLRNGMIYEVYPTVEGIGNYTKSGILTTYPISQFPTLNSVTKDSSGIQLEWKKEYGIGYSVFRKTGDGDFIIIKKIDDYETTSWVDADVDSDKEYSYYIKAYTTDGVQEYYSSESNIVTVPAMNDSTDNEADVKPTASPTPKPSSHPDANNEPNSIQELERGAKIADKNTKAIYKVTENGENTAVEYVMSTLKNPTSISVPDSVKLEGKIYKVTSIGKAALKNNKKLKTIKIGKNVKKIGRQAFSGCTKLRNMTLGKNVTIIGANAFSKCTALTMVTIPAKVKKIGNKAFYQCKNLRYILVKTKKLKAKEVGNNAFGKGYISPRVKTDKSVWKQYSRIFLSKGMSKKAVFIIDPVKLVI